MESSVAHDIRAEMGRLMAATVSDERAHYDWLYDAVRPCVVPRSWKPGMRVKGDCSKGVQFICKWGGAPDPMHENYDAFGNSQTLWLRNQHVAHPSLLLVGDAVTFGPDGNEHAAMVYKPGADPIMWSFGHPGTPNFYPLSYDRRAQQYLRFAIPDYVPTPQDKLRARTGWFAWVAWKQGEGDWLHYGAANASVRPSVPKVIPPLWWKRYAKFLANRQHGNVARAA